MQIRAKVIGCENREIETKRGKQFLTELFIIDADNVKNLYVGQILDEKFHSYKESEIVNFTVAAVSERNKKIYLSLLPQYNVENYGLCPRGAPARASGW